MRPRRVPLPEPWHRPASSSALEAARQPGGFYKNAAVEQFAAKPSSTFSLRQLVFFARGIVGRDDREAEDRLIRGGNFVRAELPIRLAHRLRDLQSLPYVVNMHPSISQVYRLYTDAFEQIRKFPPIRTMLDNDAFCDFLSRRLDEHRVVIPHVRVFTWPYRKTAEHARQLAIGMAESSAAAHLHPAALDDFMTRMLRSRISRRVLSEQHLALTSQFHGRAPHGDPGHHYHFAKHDAQGRHRFVGVIDTDLCPAAVVHKCAELVEEKLDLPVPVLLDGELSMRFAYVPDHLEYMIFELLKNSARATVSRHGGEKGAPPIRATIASSNDWITIRVSDQGGGISPPPHPIPSPYDAGGGVGAARREVFSFARLAVDEDPDRTGGQPGGGEGGDERRAKRRDVVDALKTLGGRGLSGTVREQVATRKEPNSEAIETATSGGEDAIEKDAAGLARLGIGLPLSAIFAQYFGGSLDMYSVDGFGADAILKIPKLGDVMEAA